MMPTAEAEINVEIGRRVRAACKARGVTQVAMAMHLGISPQQLAKYENGANRLSVRALLNIARILETGIKELLPPFAVAGVGGIDVNLAAALGDLSPDVRKSIGNLIDAIAEAERQKAQRATGT